MRWAQPRARLGSPQRGVLLDRLRHGWVFLTLGFTWSCALQADQTLGYALAPGVATWQSARQDAFGVGTLIQRRFHFVRLLLADTPIQRSELGEIFQFFTSGADVLGASLVNRALLRRNFALLVGKEICETPGFEQMSRFQIEPCGKKLCARIELRDGRTRAGPLWFQNHTRRRLLFVSPGGNMRAVRLTKNIRLRVNFSSTSPTETGHASRP